MGDGFPIDIILFAMVAAFIVLRLRSVLGRRTGHERQRPDPFSTKPQPRAKDKKGEKQGPEKGADKVVQLPDRGPAPGVEAETPLLAALNQIKAADPRFDPDEFVTGALTAFEYVVEAFAEGNADKLRPLLSDEVYDNFASAIEARKQAGETLETTVISIKSMDLLEASLEDGTAFVSVKFDTEQINVTLNEAGDVVDGDADHITRVVDIWTFGRDTQSRDPNWRLVRTEIPQ
ncbi:MAG: Tim44 domain-containing protein [Proteobacteria bacterium]|nr:Tim44 domain-containing protein [Pseudomonadota bacterium]